MTGGSFWILRVLSIDMIIAYLFISEDEPTFLKPTEYERGVGWLKEGGEGCHRLYEVTDDFRIRLVASCVDGEFIEKK